MPEARTSDAGPVMSLAPPFTDRCYRCDHPAFVDPVVRFTTARGATRCVYECPRCRHSWWSELDTANLGEDYADAEVEA